jgi:hypothetical protein
MKEAAFEEEATTSLLVVDPTLIAVEMQPGPLMPFLYESLPAAMTVAIPTERRLSMAGLRGSESQDVVLRTPSPRLMLTEAIL